MISTKLTYLVNPLNLIQDDGKLNISFKYLETGDVLLTFYGLSDIKIGRSSTKEILAYSKICKDPNVISYWIQGSCAALTISDKIAKSKGTSPLRISTHLILKYANTFIRRTLGTQFYIRKYRS